MQLVALLVFIKISSALAQPINTIKLTAVTENLPPYQIVKNNQLIGGTSYQLTQELFKRTGYQVNYQVLPWARAYYIAEHTENVVIFSIVRSKAREQKFKWIGKLRELSYSFYAINKDETVTINSLDDAKLLTVVAVRNSYESQSLIRQGFIVDKNLILANSVKQAWQMLLKGRADLTYANALIGNEIFQRLNLAQDPFIKQPFDVENNDLYIAASLKTSDSIVEKLTQALTDIKNDGTFYQIHNQLN